MVEGQLPAVRVCEDLVPFAPSPPASSRRLRRRVRAIDIQIIKTPVRAPRANAIAERVVAPSAAGRPVSSWRGQIRRKSSWRTSTTAMWM
jgi:hypothetical protein